ncbi:MAG: DMT family transporter [Porphyromonas sp.]|nr:DMT family transporter [Porphyromonas sp.]
MKSEKRKGYIAGLLSAATFGLIPLFTVPLMRYGMATETILIYRFAFATLMVAVVMIVKGISFREGWKHLRVLLALSTLYFCSAFFLINGYHVMPSGVATVIHFMYPLMVALLMFLFFKQKMTPRALVSLVVAFAGVVLLSGVLATDGILVRLIDMGWVAFSGFCYAVYIIVVNKSTVGQIPKWRLTFYLMLFCTVFFILLAIAENSLVLPPDTSSWGLLFLLGLVPTVISNLFLVLAIPRIGSTATSIMGVLEPLTAVVVGVLVLGERLTLSNAVGMVAILAAVALLVSEKGEKV